MPCFKALIAKFGSHVFNLRSILIRVNKLTRIGKYSPKLGYKEEIDDTINALEFQ